MYIRNSPTRRQWCLTEYILRQDVLRTAPLTDLDRASDRDLLRILARKKYQVLQHHIKGIGILGMPTKRIETALRKRNRSSANILEDVG